MQEMAVSTLPERYCNMETHVSADVNEFHFLALVIPNEVDNVEVLETSTYIVFVIDAMCRVAASCSPVGGVTLQGSHSCQIQAIHVPVVGVLVNWGVVLEGTLYKSGKFAILIAPGHHQGPGCAELSLQITVSWETVSRIVVKPVDSTL